MLSRKMQVYEDQEQNRHSLFEEVSIFCKSKIKPNDIRHTLYEIIIILSPTFKKNALLCNIYGLEDAIRFKMLLLPHHAHYKSRVMSAVLK